MDRLSSERELYQTLNRLEDGSARPGSKIAARALDLLEQGRALDALNLCLRAMRHSARWWSLAAEIGQHVKDDAADE